MSLTPPSKIRPAVAVLMVLALEVVSGALPIEAQSVLPVKLDHGTVEAETAASTTGGEQRLDAEIFETRTVIGGVEEEISVSRSIVDELCGDSDGCTLRMVLIRDASGTDPGPSGSDVRFFTIRDSGTWSANSGGGDHSTNGEISSTPHEIVFQLGSSPGCRLQDDNGTNQLGIPFQRFELVALGDSVFNSPVHCLLRIED